MSQNPVAASILELEGALDQARTSLSAAAGVSHRVVWAVVAHVDASMQENVRCRDLGDEVIKTGEQMRRASRETEAVIVGIISEAIDGLRGQLWMTRLPPPDSSSTHEKTVRDRGHLREFSVPGEPELPPGYRYEATPLLTPDVPIDIDFARQGQLGNCYFITAINAVAQWHPDAFADMVKPDPDDENFVIVTVHGGTYRLRATLPVDEKTGREVYSTSPDGSTLVSYLEKAAAAHMGAWNDLNHGFPVYVLWWLVGDRYPYMHVRNVASMPDEDVREILSSGSLGSVVVPRSADPSRVSVSSKLNLVAGHAYTVRRPLVSAGHMLHNPWLDLHPQPMSVQNLRDLGADLSWASHEPYTPRTHVGGIAREDS